MRAGTWESGIGQAAGKVKEEQGGRDQGGALGTEYALTTQRAAQAETSKRPRLGNLALIPILDAKLFPPRQNESQAARPRTQVRW